MRDACTLTLVVDGEDGEPSHLQVRMLATAFHQLAVSLPVHIDSAKTYLISRTGIYRALAPIAATQ
jgi:hypothetical protein